MEIGELASKGDLAKAYNCLTEVYRFFLEKGAEAPGEYKALHMVLLVGEMRSEIPSVKSRG